MIRILKKIYYALIRPFRTIYRFIFRPKTFGVKSIVFCNGKVLLVKISYHKKYWTFPGGGLKRNEEPKKAAVREAYEEAHVRIENPILLTEYKHTRHFTHDTVYCYIAEVADSHIAADNQEVTAVGWFELDALPEPYAPAVKLFKELWRDKPLSIENIPSNK